MEDPGQRLGFLGCPRQVDGSWEDGAFFWEEVLARSHASRLPTMVVEQIRSGRRAGEVAAGLGIARATCWRHEHQREDGTATYSSSVVTHAAEVKLVPLLKLEGELGLPPAG